MRVQTARWTVVVLLSLACMSGCAGTRLALPSAESEESLRHYFRHKRVIADVRCVAMEIRKRPAGSFLASLTMVSPFYQEGMDADENALLTMFATTVIMVSSFYEKALTSREYELLSAICAGAYLYGQGKIDEAGHKTMIGTRWTEIRGAPRFRPVILGIEWTETGQQKALTIPFTNEAGDISVLYLGNREAMLQPSDRPGYTRQAPRLVAKVAVPENPFMVVEVRYENNAFDDVLAWLDKGIAAASRQAEPTATDSQGYTPATQKPAVPAPSQPRYVPQRPSVREKPSALLRSLNTEVGRLVRAVRSQKRGELARIAGKKHEDARAKALYEMVRGMVTRGSDIRKDTITAQVVARLSSVIPDLKLTIGAAAVRTDDKWYPGVLLTMHNGHILKKNNGRRFITRSGRRITAVKPADIKIQGADDQPVIASIKGESGILRHTSLNPSELESGITIGSLSTGAILATNSLAHATTRYAEASDDSGQFDEVRSHCYDAIGLDPEYGEAYEMLGAVLYELGSLAHKKGNHEHALDLYREGLYRLYQANQSARGSLAHTPEFLALTASIHTGMANALAALGHASTDMKARASYYHLARVAYTKALTELFRAKTNPVAQASLSKRIDTINTSLGTMPGDALCTAALAVINGKDSIDSLLSLGSDEAYRDLIILWLELIATNMEIPLVDNDQRIFLTEVPLDARRQTVMLLADGPRSTGTDFILRMSLVTPVPPQQDTGYAAALASSNDSVQDLAMEQLAAMTTADQPVTPDAIDDILRLLKDGEKDAWLRHTAAMALATIGRATAGTIVINPLLQYYEYAGNITLNREERIKPILSLAASAALREQVLKTVKHERQRIEQGGPQWVERGSPGSVSKETYLVDLTPRLLNLLDTLSLTVSL